MGYTHYFGADEWTAEDAKAYKKALPIIRKIIARYKNLVQYENDDGRPPLVNEEMIHLNGIGDDGHETFIARPGVHNEFCKTARKPYDIVTCEILLVLDALIPGFHINSDGFSGMLAEGAVLDGEWEQAIKNVEQYGFHFHTEIVKERKPYCDMQPILEKMSENSKNWIAGWNRSKDEIIQDLKRDLQSSPLVHNAGEFVTIQLNGWEICLNRNGSWHFGDTSG